MSSSPPSSVVGVVAGLGPLAGAHLYRRLVETTPASRDDEHLAVILISDPAIPSRAEHLLADGESPVPALGDVLRRLCAGGATLIAIASTTTHAYYDELASVTPVPIVHLLRALGVAVAGAGLRRPGVVATSATVARRLLDAHMPPDAELLYPGPQVQGRVQQVIDAVKGGGRLERGRAAMGEILHEPCWEGADGFVFACTETALLLPEAGDHVPVISATDVLVAEILGYTAPR